MSKVVYVFKICIYTHLYVSIRIYVQIFTTLSIIGCINIGIFSVSLEEPP